MHALGDEVRAEVMHRATRDGWLWPFDGRDASELVVALAESAGIDAQRARIRELPPISTTDARDIETVVAGFPNATLRLLWGQTPECVEFLAELPCTKLQLDVGRWTAEPPRFSESLSSLVISGGISEIEAPGLRELEVSSWSFEMKHIEKLAAQLEVLRVLNRIAGEVPHHFPRLRELRIPISGDWLRVGGPLQRIHVEQTSGRELTKHPAVGPDTRIRADDWAQPDPILLGDPRLVWIGSRHPGWASMLASLPNLEVAEVDDLALLPPDVLPTPWMLSTVETSTAARRSWLEAWARRGRPWVLKSRNPKRRNNLLRRVKTFSLAYSKKFLKALNGEGLFALSAHEALYWQAVLREAEMDLEIVAGA